MVTRARTRPPIHAAINHGGIEVCTTFCPAALVSVTTFTACQPNQPVAATTSNSTADALSTPPSRMAPVSVVGALGGGPAGGHGDTVSGAAAPPSKSPGGTSEPGESHAGSITPVPERD